CVWISGIFKKKEKTIDEDYDVHEEPISEDVSMPMDIIVEPIEEDSASIEHVIDVQVESPQDEEIVSIPVEEPQGDIDVSVEEVKEVELSENDPEYLLKKLGPYDPRKDLEHYKFPSLSLLKVYDNETAPVINQEEQQANANRIVTTLRNYGIEIESIKATVGPTVTLYEIVPQAGVRISKIQNLENDIMLSLSAMGIRIIAPIPGKGTIGIEVPNEKPQVVSMHSVIASKRFQEEQKMKLPISIGRTITNEVFMFDLAKTPHLLVAGATGQGKSVAINAIITSLLYKKHPAELKFVMVDPKMVEFAPYKPLLRHYLAATPDTEDENIVIVDCDKVVNTLNSLVIEMENRYKLLMDAGVRNLEDYNDKFVSRRLNPEKLVAESLHHQFLPYIVIIIDEYGDFIMQAGKQVETPIARITQKARAVGMHMILATQRPSVNIVTGVIKANIPTRIALRTQSVVDSRTVLDTKGADQLIGRGDMLYSGNGNITRLQCAFVDTPEVDAIVEHIEKQQHYFEPYQLPEYIPEGSEGEALAPGAVDLKRLDPMFADVARYVVTKQEGSTSRLQRAFEIGYNRAGKLSDQLEAAGIVGPNKGPKGRDVLIQSLDELDKKLEELGC
ncbi:MAG: DNA translocase FtsK, partial [Paludibacteraceae bacterium]|nr:DNA translocase FtsK [Paludibacteraceae bacterium]